MRHGLRKRLHIRHRKALLNNLAKSLFEHERIVTTITKAKILRPVAEKMITLSREQSLRARRELIGSLREKKIVQKMFDDIAKRYIDRPGGYLRITKLGQRWGDSAPLASIEMIKS